SFVGANLSITPRGLTVTADAQTKVYGAADPALTYTHGALYNGDTDSVFSGALARTAGEDVGSYAISQGTLAANSDYTIGFTGNTLTITQADASITVNGYSGVYNAAPHRATGSATGVHGENLSSLLNLGATFINVPGGTAYWTFAGNTNYKTASGSVSIVIAKAN